MMLENQHFWDQSYPHKVKWNIQEDAGLWTGPLYHYFDSSVHKYPQKTAFTFLDRKWSWQEMGVLVNRLAKGLHGHGIEKGIKVGLCLPNCHYYMVAYYALAKTGATIVNYNPLYAEDELARQIEDSQTDYIITVDLKQIYPKLEKMLHATRLNQLIICPFADCLPFPKNLLFPFVKRDDVCKIPNNDRHIPFKKLVENDGAYTPPAIDPIKDVVLFQYTGGTTGHPKAAMLTHANLTANVEQIVRWFHDCHHGEEKILAVIPFFHVFAMTSILNFATRCGFEIIATPRFDILDTLELIDKHKPQLFPAVPAIYNAINNFHDLKKYDLSSLRYCISGGAPLPAEVKRDFEYTTGCVLVEGYGLSETSPVLCVNPLDGKIKTASIGLPVPGTVIELHCPETGELINKPHKRGEIWAKGPQVMAGYWNRPEETAHALQSGFFRTGDVAEYDEDGYLFIVDRIKDLILVNGYNVYPRLIEEAIYTHPSVEECVVAGIKDIARGEVPKAWIKLKDGMRMDDHDMRAFLEEKISRIEMPRQFEFRTNPLPKTMIGKLSKKDLLEEDSKK